MFIFPRSFTVNKKSLKPEVSAGTTWIEIRWNLTHDDCVDHYMVGISDGQDFANTEQTHETSFNKTELATGHSYTFNVTVHGSDEAYGSFRITAETTSLGKFVANNRMDY